MIRTLEISNFKSIRKLSLDCNRINILVGEPNTGKSNILEALGIFSYGYYWRHNFLLRDFVRYEKTNNLFYDESLDEEIEIRADDKTLTIKFKDGSFSGEWMRNGTSSGRLFGTYESLEHGGTLSDELIPFKFYRFAPLQQFPRTASDFLLPPSGQNLLSVLLSHKELRTIANDLFAPFGLRLGLRPHEHRIEVIKQLEDIIISYPYSLASDTLQRIVFYLVAVLSNKSSIITFEEPESHAFPYYTKYLAETIALDTRDNQFFIATHNPYLLMPLLEKSPKEDVAVFVTYYEEHQTKTRKLSPEQLEKITEVDIFSNLDLFLPNP